MGMPYMQSLAIQQLIIDSICRCAAHINSNQWQTKLDANQSDIPQGSGLVSGDPLPLDKSGGTEYDNAWYSGSTSANPSALLALIGNNCNWTGNNGSYSPQTSFTISTVDATITGDAGWEIIVVTEI